MKKVLTFLLVAIAGSAYSQECRNFYYMINNAEVEMTLFDKNGSKAGVQTWKITDLKNEGNGFTSSVVSTMTDSKGRELGKGTGTFRCDGGKLMADMAISLPHDPSQQYNEMQAKLGDSYIEYPSSLSEGMVLKDASMEVNMNTNGMPGTAQLNMTGRKVVGKEKVSSDAGSWDAFKITYDALMKVRVMGIGVPVKTKVTEWFVPDFGIVKTESHNKNGKMVGSSLLTSLKK